MVHAPITGQQDVIIVFSTDGCVAMTKAGKRLLDLGLLTFGFLLAVALLNVDRLGAGASRVVAISVIGWLMTSLPLGVLIGHCALRED